MTRANKKNPTGWGAAGTGDSWAEAGQGECVSLVGRGPRAQAAAFLLLLTSAKLPFPPPPSRPRAPAHPQPVSNLAAAACSPHSLVLSRRGCLPLLLLFGR